MRMTDFMSNCWLLPSTRSAAHSSQTRQKRERERCGIQTSSDQNYIYISHQSSMHTSAIFITVSLFWHINICKHVTTMTFAKKGRGIKSHFKFWAQSVFGTLRFFRAQNGHLSTRKRILVGMNVGVWPRPLSSIYPSFKDRNWNVTPKICEWHVPVFETSHSSTGCHDYLE